MLHDTKNIMVILSSPSGVGKTTITKKIQQKYNTFKISVSHTTRKSRSNEVDGVDYFFTSEKNFKNLIEKNEFYEHAEIFGNLYGTSKKIVDKTLEKNDIIFDIDWQGTKQLSNFNNLNFIKIFLVTSKKGDLKDRLLKRNQDSSDQLDKRLQAFDEDVKHWKDYDYIVINESLENCFKQIEKIILSHKETKMSQIIQ